MPSTYRVTQIECPYHYLVEGDRCYHFGEYTSGGGFGASETNQLIHNLKKKPSGHGPHMAYKTRACEQWARILRDLIPPANATGDVTFVTIPGSKPVGHADYDPRMLQVLQRWAAGNNGVDLRADVLIQTAERAAQHEGPDRLTPAQIAAMMDLGAGAAKPLRSTVVLVDDVLTLGASFKAAQGMIAQLPGVSSVHGLFLAKTVWPNPFANVDLSALPVPS